mgnify:CR=1 FL=1
MNKITAWGVTIAGLLLLLPNIGVTQLGSISWNGFISWAVPIVLILVGIEALIRKYKK